MQQLLTYIHEQTRTIFERWYSLAQRLETAAHLNQRALLITLFKEHEIILRPLDGYPSVLYGEQPTGVSDAMQPSFTLLLWSQCEASLAKTHQWDALAMRLLTLQLYQDMYGSLPLHIQWIVETGHEQADSSIHSRISIMEHNHLFLQVDGCICDLPAPSSFPAMALGTKGVLRVSLEVDTHQTRMPALYGSILPDAAWRLVWCLSSLKDVREELLIEHFYDTLTPPDDDEIALLIDSTFVGLPFEQGTTLFGLQGLQARYAAQLLPSCTITSVHSTTKDDRGYPSQEQPSDTIRTQSQALLNFYLVPEQQPQDIFSKLQKHVVASGFQDVRLRLLASTPTIHTPFRNSFIQAIHAATTQVQASISGTPLHTKALTMIPFATESVFSSSLLPPLTMPVIFHQFGLLDNNTLSDTHIQPAQLAHLAHFCVFLEGFRHATTTTR